MGIDLYVKKGNRYKAIAKNDFIGFPSDGVWLVEFKEGCKSSECILKIGELPELYPFANLVMSKDLFLKAMSSVALNNMSLNDYTNEVFKEYVRLLKEK